MSYFFAATTIIFMCLWGWQCLLTSMYKDILDECELLAEKWSKLNKEK